MLERFPRQRVHGDRAKQLVVEIGRRAWYLLADQPHQTLQHAQFAVLIKAKETARPQLRISHQPHLDLGGGQVQQERHQAGVTMKSGDEATAFACCVEQTLNPLVQFIV